MTLLILAAAAAIGFRLGGFIGTPALKLWRRAVLTLPRLACLQLAGLLCLLALASSAAAECRWLLWAQNESRWSWRLLNFLPGPTHGAPYIHTEYSTLRDCEESRRKRIDAVLDYLKTPEGKDGTFIAHYACIPLPLKPERIGPTEWK